jgi:hypothetical protein
LRTDSPIFPVFFRRAGKCSASPTPQPTNNKSLSCQGLAAATLF